MRGHVLVPRALMAEMPEDWRARFAACLSEILRAFPGWDPSAYLVRKIDPATFREVDDPFAGQADAATVERMRTGA